MNYDVYVGSYQSKTGGDGITHLRLDTQARTLTRLESYPAESDNPSFLVVGREHVYAVSERMDHGYVSAFRRDPQSGSLTFRNRIETPGTAMCHLTAWPDGRHLSAANYASGSLVTCSLTAEGDMDALCQLEQHHGVGFDSQGRQEGPHVHSTVIGPDGKTLYAADLGLDQVFCYDTHPDGTVTLAADDRQIHLPGGEGPRHFVFSDDGARCYLVTEMGNKLFVLQRSGDGYRTVQTEALLPPDFTDFNTAADIHFSLDRRFLYASCRGRDCLTAFRVDGETGRVTLTGYYDSWGRCPRNFCMVPDNRLVLITNQVTGNLVLCPRDPKTGAIGSPVAEESIPQAVFVDLILL